MERYAKLTREGAFNLTPQELFWQARHRHLKDHGYILRPRYAPGWKPSWIGTNYDPFFCEDSITLLVCVDSYALVTFYHVPTRTHSMDYFTLALPGC